MHFWFDNINENKVEYDNLEKRTKTLINSESERLY